MKDDPKIKIPPITDDSEITNLPTGKVGYNIQEKVKEIHWILYSIIVVIVLTLISIIVSVSGLFIDQMRYNNAAYRYYVEKIQTLDELKAQEQKLLYQIKQDQQTIIKQNKALIKSKT